MLLRRDKVANALGSGSALGNEALHGECVGRYKEITDYLETKYEEWTGGS